MREDRSQRNEMLDLIEHMERWNRTPCVHRRSAVLSQR